MAVRSTVTHKLDIPHEQDEWIEFKELGWRTLEAAREVKARNSLLSFRDLGPEFFKTITTPTEGDAKKAPEVAADPAETYDMSLLLRSSIVAWSYSVPCNEENIDDLDQRTASWAFKEIIKIHFPKEADLGKVSEPLNKP
jgi:hypothetical protein